jgi:hypothetical protein
MKKIRKFSGYIMIQDFEYKFHLDNGKTLDLDFSQLSMKDIKGFIWESVYLFGCLENKTIKVHELIKADEYDLIRLDEFYDDSSLDFKNHLGLERYLNKNDQDLAS